MKSDLNFTIIVTQDEDGVFVSSCPAIPGCHSQGKTYEEAETHIKEAIRLCLEVAKTDEAYRDTIDFGEDARPRYVGITELTVPRPVFL